MKHRGSIPRIYDVLSDQWRAMTQADVDDILEMARVYGLVAALIEEGEFNRARAEVTAHRKSFDKKFEKMRVS